jgi:nucleoside-diphosphate-sugar epimerase
MRIFVTGGTGFIGKNFIKLALLKGHKVYAISRKKQKSRPSLKWLRGTLTDDWSKELEKSDVIVHLASVGVLKKNVSYSEAFNVNVLDSFIFFQNAYKNNCFNWIIAGSSSEYGESLRYKKKMSYNSSAEPIKNYELTKNIFSNLIYNFSQNNKIKCRIMRIFPTYGPGENKKRFWPSLIKAAKNNKKFYIKNPSLEREFYHIDFVVKDLLSSCNFKIKNNNFPQIWHITSGKKMTILQFAKEEWNKINNSNKIIVKKPLTSNDNYHHLSDKKSIWKT